MHVEVEVEQNVYRASPGSFVSGWSYARRLGALAQDQSVEAPQKERDHHDVMGVVELKARGNVLLRVAYSFGTQHAELHFARLTVHRRSLETTERMELHGPKKYDGNCGE
jgi:hypothetical protein